MLPIPGSIAAGTSYDRSLNINGDGTYNIVLRWRVRKYRDLTAYSSEMRADQVAVTKEWKGVTDQDLGTALDSQTGKVVQVDKQFREDCSLDIRRRVMTPAALSTGWETFDHPDGTVGVFAGTNLTDSDLTTLKGTLTTRATAGDRTSLSPRKNEFGLWDVTASYMPESSTISIKSGTWNDFGVKTDTYPAFETQNELKHHEVKVFRCYTSSKTTAESFFEGDVTSSVDPDPSGYTFVPSYRGKQSVEPRWLGANRWFAQRVMVKIAYP